MPYDPAIRATSGNNNSIGSLGGSSSAAVPSPQNVANNDLIRVIGKVGNGAQINPPNDGTWTRINGVTTDVQMFWKRAGASEPATYTFTWDGTNQPFTFNSLAAYSQTGGTVSLSAAVSSTVASATPKTSDAITPAADALVLVSYLEFVIGEPGPPIGPAGLTQVQACGGIGAPSFWDGYIYVQSGVSSGTFIAKNAAGDPNTNWFWGSGTLSITSAVSALQPPLINDEALYTPAIRSPADVVFCGSSSAIAFGFFQGASLDFAPPADQYGRPVLQKGDLMIAHIWSNGTAPGVGAFRSTPVGWTLQPNSYLENFGRLPPSASWIYYKVATSDDVNNPPAKYSWLLPAPTLNTWTGIIYVFCNADAANFFDGFKAITGPNPPGQDGNPRAPSLTPDWRNDVSLLLFAQIDPVSYGVWPIRPDAPAGYIQLANIQNQGDWQIGYLGVPNSCNPVPDVFAYTEAQQIALFGAVRYKTAWFAYSFLLKNINVAGQACAVPPVPQVPGPGPGPGPGQLIGLTYEVHEEVWGWHRHFTGQDLATPDKFISICSTSDPITAQSDDLWACVGRQVNGQTVYSIEIFDGTLNTDAASQTLFGGGKVTSVSGLGYLVGRTVQVKADGSYAGSFVVPASGIIDFHTVLPEGALNVEVGLPYTSSVLTVRQEIGGQGQTIQGLRKQWNKVWARVHKTINLLVGAGPYASGPDSNAVAPQPWRILERKQTDLLSAPPAPFTGDVPLEGNLGADFDGRVLLQQDEPYPCTILGLFGTISGGEQ